MRWLAVTLLVFLCASSAASARRLQQYDCKAAEEQCKKVTCSGIIKVKCDSTTGQVDCTCESAGLVSCFPGSALAALPGDAHKPLSELSLGDQVLTVGPDGRLGYRPVAMFSSRRPNEHATFLRVRTDAGLNLTVTPGHYLFAWKGAQAAAAYAALLRPDTWPFVLPNQLKVGDLVPVAAAVAAGAPAEGGSPALARVTAVERLTQRGVYMPHTLTGAIVVDGVVASEMTSFVPPRLAGPAAQRHLASALRLACKLLPPHVVEAAVAGISSWVHGTADASISAAAVGLGSGFAARSA